MMTVTVLGSGNAFHTDARAHSSYLIETPALTLLLDCGATTLYRLRELGISSDRIDALLFTHFHGDHMAGFPFLLLDLDVMVRRERPLLVIGPPGTQEATLRYYRACYPDHSLKIPIEYRVILDRIELDGVSIEARKLTHSEESVGYRVTASGGKCIAFSGDCLFDDALVSLVRGTDLAIVELSLRDRRDGVAHLSLEELCGQRERFETARLVVTHSTDAIALEAERLGVAEVARDGMTIRV